MKGQWDPPPSILVNRLKVKMDDITIISVLNNDIDNDIGYASASMSGDINTTNVLLSKDSRIVLCRLRDVSFSSLIQLAIDINIRVDMNKYIIDL